MNTFLNYFVSNDLLQRPQFDAMHKKWSISKDIVLHQIEGSEYETYKNDLFKKLKATH